MGRLFRITGRVVAAAAWVSLPAGCGRTASVPSRGAAATDLVVRRGDHLGRVLLTGELRAARAQEIVVPRAAGWGATIRWMAVDGTVVQAGEKVLELDTSNVAATLEERRLAALTARDELARQDAQNAIDVSTREFELEQRRTALARAEIDAAVPLDLTSRRDWEDRQLAVERARVEFDKARDDLAAARQAAMADLAVRRIELADQERRLRQAEETIASVSIAAPRAGLLLVADHPWEGRKFQIGDPTFPGITVLRVPDLSEMQVEAALYDVDDGAIAAGARARCTLDGWPDAHFPGTVTTIAPIAQEAARSVLRRAFRVTVALAATDRERMRPGMSVKVEVETERLPAVLLAPRVALDLTAAPRARLADGRLVGVTLGPCGAQACVVSSGLAEGERLRPLREPVR